MKLVFAIAVLGLFALVSGKRIKSNIYHPLKGLKFCFRRTNGTHQTGCSSHRNGNVGVVHYIKDQTELDWVIEKGDHKPYVAVLTPKMFTSKNLKKLTDSITGVVLLSSDDNEDDLRKPYKYSDDSSCPNEPNRLDPDKECSWNSAAENIMNQDWEFPIFLIEDKNTSLSIRKDCYEKFNKPGLDGLPRTWPLCAVEMKSHMYSAVDTTTCMRRSSIVNNLNPTFVCDKMGDQNIFMFLSISERNNAQPDTIERDNSVIVLTTKLDSFTSFDNAEHGADSPSLGIVTLLTAAELISRQKREILSGEVDNVLFAFFNGETFGYIGSSRMAYDMSEGKFPFELNNDDYPNGEQPTFDTKKIRVVLDIDQLFRSNKATPYYMHVDNPQITEDFRNHLEAVASPVSVNLATGNKGLPPSSLQSILKSNRSVPGIVLTGFNEEYKNDYYHSIYDNAEYLEYNSSNGENQDIVKQVADVAELIARFVYREGRGQNTNAFSANRTRINSLLQCYLGSTVELEIFVQDVMKHLEIFAFLQLPT